MASYEAAEIIDSRITEVGQCGCGRAAAAAAAAVDDDDGVFVRWQAGGFGCDGVVWQKTCAVDVTRIVLLLCAHVQQCDALRAEYPTK